MEPRDLEKLLGGYATNTLTDEERQALFDAALHDQALFNTLADEQALKELLDNPQHRQQLLRALKHSQPPRRANWLSQVLAWTQQGSNIAIAGSVVAALLAFTFVVQLIDDVGPVPSSLKSTREVKPPAPVSKPLPLQQTEPVTSVTPSVPPGDQSLTSSDSTRSASTSLKSSPQASSSPAPSPPAPSLMAKRKKRAVADGAREELQDEADSRSAKIPLARLSQMASPAEKAQLSPQNGWQVSARELFYQTASEMGTGHESTQERRQGLSRQRLESKPTLKRLPTKEVETLEQFTDYSTQPDDQETPSAQLEESQTDIQRFQAGDTPKEEPTKDVLPLGLRYSILQQQPDDTFSEVDMSSPMVSTEMFRLTIEANQPGYLYVLGSVGQKWQVVFPLGSEGSRSEDNSALIEGGTRYPIPETSGFAIKENQSRSHWMLLFSRDPLAIHSLVPSLSPPKSSSPPDQGSQHVFIEKVNERLQTGAREHAVYIIQRADHPPTFLLTEFVLHYR